MTEPSSDEASRLDPMTPHLLDILSHPASEDLILAGGFGIRMKQLDLGRQRLDQATLIQPFPLARPTQDLDFFLRIECWIMPERGQSVRAMVDDLGYETYTPEWQFGKPFDPKFPDYKMRLDFLSRHPREDEGVKVKAHRVGSGAGVGLHGHDTPEAFAIEDNPTPLRLSGSKTNGEHMDVTVLVPHSYAALNMKIKAAHDWLQGVGKKTGAKHLYDVYTLIAMILPEEIEECRLLSAKYADHTMAQENKSNAVELFGTSEERGVTELRRQLGDASIDYATFWEGLCSALGVAG